MIIVSYNKNATISKNLKIKNVKGGFSILII